MAEFCGTNSVSHCLDEIIKAAAGCIPIIRRNLVEDELHKVVLPGCR